MTSRLTSVVRGFTSECGRVRIDLFADMCIDMRVEVCLVISRVHISYYILVINEYRHESYLEYTLVITITY